MSSYVDMSLEDIIQKKKRETKGKPKAQLATSFKRQAPTQKVAITDARNKIISKKRTKIRDAREKLAELAKQKDAREKLDLLRKKRQTAPTVPGKKFYKIQGKLVRNLVNKERTFLDASRQVVSQPISTARGIQTKQQYNTKKFTENRSVGTRSLNKFVKPKPILRTVENDLDIIDDPMGEEQYRQPKPSLLNRKASLQLKIVAHNNELKESRSSVISRMAVTENDRSPPRPQSILKKRPMAAHKSESKVDKNDKLTLEYRIIVSNLRNTVTGGDIEELFGDVGGMTESRLVRPGTAEVLYKSLEDAQRAVDLYHNRQLDGQPMNCLLVTPRNTTTAATTKGISKPVLYSTNSNVEPDIDTFHKVLFSNF